MDPTALSATHTPPAAPQGPEGSAAETPFDIPADARLAAGVGGAHHTPLADPTPPALRGAAERECLAMCRRALASSEAGHDEQALHDAHQAFALAHAQRLSRPLQQTLQLMAGLHARLGDTEGAQVLWQRALPADTPPRPRPGLVAQARPGPSSLRAALQDHVELVLAALDSPDPAERDTASFKPSTATRGEPHAGPGASSRSRPLTA